MKINLLPKKKFSLSTEQKQRLASFKRRSRRWWAENWSFTLLMIAILVIIGSVIYSVYVNWGDIKTYKPSTQEMLWYGGLILYFCIDNLADKIRDGAKAIADAIDRNTEAHRNVSIALAMQNRKDNDSKS